MSIPPKSALLVALTVLVTACEPDEGGKTSTTTPVVGTPTTTDGGCPTGLQDNDGDGRCEAECATAFLDCNDHGACDDASGTSVCVCEPEYEGHFCEQCAAGYQDNAGDGLCVQDCATAALDCGDHGACDDTDGEPVCACEPEYDGAACERCATGHQDHDGNGVCAEDCATVGLDCGVGGFCDDAAGEALCLCYPEYEGDACETCATGFQDHDGDGVCDDDCTTAGLDCGPGGLCVDSGGVPECVCDPMYEGLACESCAPGYQDEDGDGVCLPDCVNSGLDCGAHGVCATDTGLAECVCDPGWSGPTCGPTQVLAVFVDDDAPPGGDGRTWETALNDLSDTWAVFRHLDVFIKEGTYTGIGNGVVLDMDAGGRVYGGFPQDLEGTISDLALRNPATFPTILSGDANGDGLGDGDAEHVVVMNDQTVLDGVTVTSGSATTFEGGGGVFLKDVQNARITGVTILDNRAMGSNGSAGTGAGISCRNSTGVVLEETWVVSNTAYGPVGPDDTGWGAAGGGIASYDCDLDIRNAQIVQNAARGGAGALGAGQGGGSARGGGMYLLGGTVTLSGTSLSSNSAQGGRGSDGNFGLVTSGGRGGSAQGGGIAIQLASLSGDVTMIGNWALGGAGGGGADASCTGSPANGYPGGDGSTAAGGAISNRGSFVSSGSIIQGNEVRGGAGGAGGNACAGGTPGATGSAGAVYGGGIEWEFGALNISGSTVSNNFPTDLYP